MCGRLWAAQPQVYRGPKPSRTLGQRFSLPLYQLAEEKKKQTCMCA